MMDLLKLDIAIAEAREFLSMARETSEAMHNYGSAYEGADVIGLCSKTRAKSLVLYRSLIDLRRKEGDRNVSLRETPR